MPTNYISIINDISQRIDKIERLGFPTTISNQVDVSARLDGLRKSLDNLLSSYKEHLSSKVGKTGGVLEGTNFEYVLTVYPTEKFDIKQFRVDHPKVCAKYTNTAWQTRTTFRPRG